MLSARGEFVYDVFYKFYKGVTAGKCRFAKCHNCSTYNNNNQTFSDINTCDIIIYRIVGSFVLPVVDIITLDYNKLLYCPPDCTRLAGGCRSGCGVPATAVPGNLVLLSWSRKWMPDSIFITTERISKLQL